MKINVQNLNLKLGTFEFSINNWTLNSGEHLLIEGSSGSGKTSFLHLLAGLLKPTHGKIQIDEFEIPGMSKVELCHFRRLHVGMIFQKLHLLPHLNLIENVNLGTFKSASDQSTFQIIKRLGLENRTSNLPSQLSLGEIQRTSVARALASAHSLVLADEPTASLDDKNADLVFQLLKEKMKDKTLIVVTHDNRARSYFENRLNFKELISK